MAAVTVANGSFEDIAVGSGGFDNYASGSTIGGWTVGGGGVDLIGTFWNAQDGNQSLDLNRTEPGSISQTLMGLTVGQLYEVTFFLSGNRERADGSPAEPQLRTLDLTVGGTTQGFTFDTEASSPVSAQPDSMNWERNTFRFVASSPSEMLTFTSATQTTSGSSPAGPALDNVSISAVPLPLGLGLLLSALGGLVAWRRLGAPRSLPG